MNLPWSRLITTLPLTLGVGVDLKLIPTLGGTNILKVDNIPYPFFFLLICMKGSGDVNIHSSITFVFYLGFKIELCQNKILQGRRLHLY